MQRLSRRSGGAILSFLAVIASALAKTPATKPKLPPGRDPGGALFGLITLGIDPSLPYVARCLARDGEGELNGWDLVDRTRAPFRFLQAGQPGDESAIAALPCDGRVRVSPVRIDPADGVTYGKALAFFSTTPVRVIVLPAANVPADWTALTQAAAAFPQLTVLIETVAKQPAFVGRPNMVAVPPGTAFDEALRRAR
jgi:hypothetical protein